MNSSQYHEQHQHQQHQPTTTTLVSELCTDDDHDYNHDEEDDEEIENNVESNHHHDGDGGGANGVDNDDDNNALIEATLAPSEETLRQEMRERLRDRLRDELLQESQQRSHSPTATSFFQVDPNGSSGNLTPPEIVEGQLLNEMDDDEYNNQIQRNLIESKRKTRRFICLLVSLGICCSVVVVIVVVMMTEGTSGNASTIVFIDNDEINDNNTEPLPPGRATTSRFWDCGGGDCGCGYERDDEKFLEAGRGNNPSFCYSNAMFQAPDDNPFNASFYGTAAISAALGGNFFLGPGCGACWVLTGTSTIDDSVSTIVVRGASFCPTNNRRCADGAVHFNLAAPGFFPPPDGEFKSSCNVLEPEFSVGLQSCADWPNEPCDCSVILHPTLRAGCENFLSLQWDDIVVDYTNVTCPDELLVTPCQDDGTWPLGPIADECAFFPDVVTR